MKYTIKAHPTKYSGVMFRSRLEARWAAFFDLAGIKWEYEPIDLNGWTPDFRISLDCRHSECMREHIILVEVKPYYSLDEFIGHECTRYPYGTNGETSISADASAAFGANPSVTTWEMTHGAGGGVFDIDFWVTGAESMWKTAGNLTQWKP